MSALVDFEDVDDETVMSMLDFTNCKVVAEQVVEGAHYYKMQFHHGAVELLVEQETVIKKAPGELLAYFLQKISEEEAAAPPPPLQ